MIRYTSQRQRRFCLIVLLLCALLPWSTSLHAAQHSVAMTRIVRVTGDVKAINQLDGSIRPLLPNDTLRERDKIVVETQSKVTINLDGRILIYLDDNAVLDIESLRYHPKSQTGAFELRIAQGSMRMATNRRYNYKRRPLLLKAPHVAIGVRGTRFWMEITEEDVSSSKGADVSLAFLCLRPTCVMTNEVNRRVMSKPNQFMEVKSRFKRLPRPRPATASELAYVDGLTPPLPEASDQGEEDADWSAKPPAASQKNSGSGASSAQSSAQEKRRQERQQEQQEQQEEEKKEKKKQKSASKDLDWKSILIALGVFFLVVLLMVGAWFFEKKRKK